MPVNLDALKRYHILNECFSNKYGKYTIEKLIKKCSDDIGHDVKERTIREDIKNMRSGELGYEAPIVIDKQTKCYHYSDPNFSIKNCTLNSQTIKNISFAISILKEYKGFNFFESFNGIFDKLETDIYIKTKNEIENIIDFEKFTSYIGFENLQTLLDAIINKTAIKLEYQRFVNDKPATHILHPYFLKEYQHRWYLLAYLERKDMIITLALDRIKSIEIQPLINFIPNTKYDFIQIFEKVIGISEPNSEPQDVILKFKPIAGKYFISQPFHKDFEIITDNENELIIKMNLHINYELEKLILSNLGNIKVLAPQSLIDSIDKKIQDYLNE
ncbi:MAG: hypothetical protein RLZZ175_3058 [Bacteroidota bacterium]|jgi:predicted DNA-binding transcriptional regulator YafY